MQHRKVSCWKEAYYILSIIGAIVAAVVTVWGPHGYMDLKKSQAELQVQKEKVSALKQTNAEARARIEALKSDKRTLERVARERGYADPDELIQLIPPEQPSRKRK
jgi:cell division protein FtsB